MEIQTKQDVRAGDILLLWDELFKDLNPKHQGIRIGQALTSFNLSRVNKGYSRLVHAIIWVGNQRGEIAEASGSCGRVQVRALQPGYYIVYRCRNEDLADGAAQLATAWAGAGNISYGKSAAVQSVFHKAKFGEKGRERARMYARVDFQPRVEWASGAFCSEFVVACYQGAAGRCQPPLTGVFEVDAKHCSVRALHDRLVRAQSLFKWKGHLRQI